VALLTFFVAGYYLVKSSAERTIDPDQVRLAAEGLANQGTVTFGEALQAVSARH